MPEELWQETTARLAKRRNANCGWKGVPPRRILSSLLRCGACGSSIVSAGSQRDRGVIPYATNRNLRRTFKTLAGKAGVSKEIRDRLQNHALQSYGRSQVHLSLDHLTRRRWRTTMKKFCWPPLVS
jgi:hypothetical protein